MAWEKLGERPAWNGRFRRISVKTFRLPDGREHEFEVKQEADTVAVLALTPEQRVILVREFRVGVEDELLELPGGGIEPGQGPKAAGARELLEETGYAGELRHLAGVVDCAYSTRIKHACVATGCRRVAEPQPDETEFPEPVLMPLGDFRTHLRSGRLTDVHVGYLGLDALGLL